MSMGRSSQFLNYVLSVTQPYTGNDTVREAGFLNVGGMVQYLQMIFK